MIHLYAFVRGLKEAEPGLEVRPFGGLGVVTGAAEAAVSAAIPTSRPRRVSARDESAVPMFPPNQQ